MFLPTGATDKFKKEWHSNGKINGTVKIIDGIWLFFVPYHMTKPILLESLGLQKLCRWRGMRLQGQVLARRCALCMTSVVVQSLASRWHYSKMWFSKPLFDHNFQLYTFLTGFSNITKQMNLLVQTNTKTNTTFFFKKIFGPNEADVQMCYIYIFDCAKFIIMDISRNKCKSCP